MKFLEELDLEEGKTLTMDCPVCKGKKKFTATRVDNVILYNCFRNSCTVKGKRQVGRTVENIKRKMNGHSIPEKIVDFEMPEYFSRDLTACEDFIHRWDLSDLKLYYDVKNDRVVFPIHKKGRVVDAIGRSLFDNTAPKWYKYGTPPVPFIVGTNKYVGFIVEDCISACKVAISGFTGIALMGTSIPENFVQPIVDKVERAFVCLDRDATEKSFKLRDCLSHVIPTQIKMIDKDLKWLSVEELKEWGNKLCETL